MKIQNSLIAIFLLSSLVSFAQMDSLDCSEVLDYEELIVNHKIKYEQSEDELIEFLGKPTQITNYEDEADFFDGTNFSIYAYKNCRFIKFKRTLYLDTWHLTNGDTLDFNKIELTSHTTLEELKAIFPVAVKNGYYLEAPLVDKETFLVRISPKPCWDDVWVLYFLNGKLFKINYHRPT